MPQLLSRTLIALSLVALLSCAVGAQREPSDPKPADWTLVWADEFDGDTLNPDNWTRQVVEAGRFNREWQRYTDSTDNASVEDGNLVITLIHEGDEHAPDQYTSARLHTGHKQYWKYGKVEARIKLPGGKGMWPAFWMLGNDITEIGGDTRWPDSGEIDILEFYPARDPATVEANIHYADADAEHAQMGAVPYTLDEGTFADGFHVFAIEWDAERIAWFVDGAEYASADITGEVFAEFHEEFYILLNLACAGAGGEPDATTPFPQHMLVDWVRVYQRVE